MRTFLIKLLLRLLTDPTHKEIKDQKIQDWLMDLSAEDSGYKGYYTVRKKAINQVLGIGIGQKEYWMNLGRLAELKQMNQLSVDLIKRYGERKQSKKKGKEET